MLFFCAASFFFARMAGREFPFSRLSTGEKTSARHHPTAGFLPPKRENRFFEWRSIAERAAVFAHKVPNTYFSRASAKIISFSWLSAYKPKTPKSPLCRMGDGRRVGFLAPKRGFRHPRTPHGYFAVAFFHVPLIPAKTKRGFLTPTRSQPQLSLAVGCGGAVMSRYNENMFFVRFFHVQPNTKMATFSLVPKVFGHVLASRATGHPNSQICPNGPPNAKGTV